MKLFIIFFLILLGLAFFVPSVQAQVLNPFGIPGLNLPFQSQLEMRLCLIRRYFCGTFVLMVVTISIFLVGVMVLNNKINWGTAILIVSGLVLFTEAPGIAGYFSKSNSLVFIANPMCDCRCKNDDLPWPFTGMDFGLAGAFLTKAKACEQALGITGSQ